MGKQGENHRETNVNNRTTIVTPLEHHRKTIRELKDTHRRATRNQDNKHRKGLEKLQTKNRTAKENCRKNIGKQQEDQRNIIRECSGKQW